MIFTIDNGQGAAVRITGDVLKTAALFSSVNSVVTVMALGRKRLVMVDGAVVENYPEIGVWTEDELATIPPEWEAPVMTQWSTLNTAPLYRPMTLLERFRLAKAEDVLEPKDYTTESDVEGFDQRIYGEYMDSLNIRKYIEI
jgi:hypothetical protein